MADRLCPHCGTATFVRALPCIEGRRVHYECYCKRCDYVWEIQESPPGGIAQRRQFSRRRNAPRRRNKVLRGDSDRRKP